MRKIKPASPLAEVMGDFAEQTLEEVERKHDLERLGQRAAQIEVDLADHGMLGAYVQARREEAHAAVAAFMSADPRDAVAMAQIQAEVGGYLRVRDWIVKSMEMADTAAAIINEEYGTSNDEAQYRD